MPTNRSDALLTVAQAATLLGVHPNTIRAWTEAGRLTAYRINPRGDRRFRKGEVERLLVEDGHGAVADPGVSDERAGELAIFGRVAAGFAATPTAASVARSAVEALRTEVSIERAAMYVAEAGTAELVAHAGFVDRPAPATVPLDAGPWTSDGLLAVPLDTRRERVGVLLLDASTSAELSGAFLKSLSTMLATSIAGARLLGRARRELTRARALRSVTKELSSTLDLAAVLSEVVSMTRSLFDAEMAGLWLVEPGERPFTIAAQHDLDPAFTGHVAGLRRTSGSISARALDERRAVVDGKLDKAHRAQGIRTACVVPLLGGDEPLGILGLYHRHQRAWPDEEVALVQAFADQAAVAIQNARLYRSVAAQAVRIRSIQDLSARLNRLTDVKAIGEAIVAEAETLADYHDIRIYQVDWERRMCEPIAFTREMLEGDPDDAVALLRVEVGQGFTGWVAEHGEPLLINDALEDQRGVTIAGTDDVPESMVVVPMLYEGRALGVIVLSQLGYNRFTTDDLQTMSIFAGYAAQAMANATTYEQLVSQSSELARRADLQRRLLEINERLLSTLDQAGVLETIADGLHDVVAYDNLSIYRTDPVERVMRPVLTREQHADEVGSYAIPYGSGLMGWAVDHSQPILANDALSDPRGLQIPGTPEDQEAVIVVPLIGEGEALGALNVSRIGGPEVYFTASDFELVQLFAAQASIALRNADAHHAMSQRAETDALTGLANHGAFQRDLARLVEEASTATRAADRRVAVLMMDLDSFKYYNDRHGHPAGDELLHRAATSIYGAARTGDRVYRYGGDEFSLILPRTTVAEAARVADRIRAAVAALTDDDPTPVTITVGVAGLPGDASDRAGVIAAADRALYYGKRAGDDRVVRADHLAPELGDLRGRLEQLAADAVRDRDDEHAVEHLVERAARVTEPQAETRASLRDALLAVSRSFDARGTGARGSGGRVARLATTIAARLGIEPEERAVIELAARLHTLEDRGIAELAAIASLGEVSALIGGFRALRGSGERPRRSRRPRGSIGSHVIGAAVAYDEHTSGAREARVDRAEALERVRRDPATFRPEVIAALAEAVEHRRDAGRRRRASDRQEEAQGAA